ncbi:59d965f9-f890-45ee-8647-c8ff68811109-CDS [Sclerotinia trifoliorum]|uniref:59d965f9-f890-45ee-8647-c8ff68811109-CDS n=1 Tax=Sclerotinia trifoliorum TaxID=28548 RepID=A0A8H2VXN9_9HELO|nr:59d965f9-f890-45ee-8647-c8ff68811109-CDS [Sclerotinia trifoliorum]
MLTQSSIIACRISNSLPNTERTCRQCYSGNYSKPSFIPTEQNSTTPTSTRSSTVTSETEKLQDNSQITTRSHIYYETYRISGFHPGVYNAPPQPKSAKKLPNADLETKKIVAEHTCPITTYKHAYYKEFSIAGFDPIRTSPPTQLDPANQMADKPAEKLGKGLRTNPRANPQALVLKSAEKKLLLLPRHISHFSQSRRRRKTKIIRTWIMMWRHVLKLSKS